jgi:hypothetical protein
METVFMGISRVVGVIDEIQPPVIIPFGVRPHDIILRASGGLRIGNVEGKCPAESIRGKDRDPGGLRADVDMLQKVGNLQPSIPGVLISLIGGIPQQVLTMAGKGQNSLLGHEYGVRRDQARIIKAIAGKKESPDFVSIIEAVSVGIAGVNGPNRIRGAFGSLIGLAVGIQRNRSVRWI